MADYDNTNSGALFKNVEKAELDKPNWPDYKGSINVGGADFWISAWLKKSKDGKNYMSLSAQPKEAKSMSKTATMPAADEDSDIPF